MGTGEAFHKVGHAIVEALDRVLVYVGYVEQKNIFEFVGRRTDILNISVAKVSPRDIQVFFL